MDGICFKNQERERNDGDHEVCKINLRPFDVADIDDFMLWATDDRVSQFCTWETSTSREETMIHLRKKAIPHPWLKAICLENKPIGYVLFTPDSGNCARKGELGYVLAHKYWGKGIATCVVKMVVPSIFEEWPYLERLQAFVDDDNKGSQRVLEKVGFQKEGILRMFMAFKGKCRDMVIFSLLATDLPLH